MDLPETFTGCIFYDLLKKCGVNFFIFFPKFFSRGHFGVKKSGILPFFDFFFAFLKKIGKKLKKLTPHFFKFNFYLSFKTKTKFLACILGSAYYFEIPHLKSKMAAN